MSFFGEEKTRGCNECRENRLGVVCFLRYRDNFEVTMCMGMSYEEFFFWMFGIAVMIENY